MALAERIGITRLDADERGEMNDRCAIVHVTA